MQALRDQQKADEVVEGDRRQQQKYELPVAHRVEHQRRQRQPYHASQITAPAEHKIADQGDRQEHENELIGVEEHKSLSGAAWKAKPTNPPLNKPCAGLPAMAASVAICRTGPIWHRGAAGHISK